MIKKIVFWKHKTTGKSGHSIPIEENLADAWVEYANRKYPDIHHEVRHLGGEKKNGICKNKISGRSRSGCN